MKGAHEWGTGFPDQGVVAVGVNYVIAAEVLRGEAERKAPVVQPGAQGAGGSVGEDSARFVARICRRLVSGKDGYRVTALAQGIGQPMRRVGHAATLDAADGG